MKYLALLGLLLLPVLISNVYGEETVITELDKFNYGNSLGVIDIVEVDSDTVALSHGDAVLDESIIKTFDISPDGILTEVSSLVYEENRNVHDSTLIHLDSDTYVLAYRLGSGGANINTFDISSDGTSITELDSLNYRGQPPGAGYLSLVKVDSDTVALSSTETNSNGFIITFDISPTGDITEVSSLDTGELIQQVDFIKADSGIYISVHRSQFDSTIKTFTISNDGISIVEVQSLDYGPDAGGGSIVQVDSDTFAVAHAGSPSIREYVRTFDIPSNGATITEIENLEHDTYGHHHSFVKVDSDTFALAYMGPGYPAHDPILKIFDISADGTSIVETLGFEHDVISDTENNSLIYLDSGFLVLAYSGLDDLGYIKTFGIFGLNSEVAQMHSDMLAIQTQLDDLTDTTVQNTSDISSLQAFVDSLLLAWQALINNNL